MSSDAEQQKYEDEVKELKQWWEDPRWRYTRRPYTAESIVSKRGTIKIEYPSNTMSKKLWDLVESRFKVCQVAMRFVYQLWLTTIAERRGQRHLRLS